MYYKQVIDGYIVAIGEGEGQTPITQEEYDNIMSIIKSAPKKDGYGYRLREDLTWEEYTLPQDNNN